MKQLISTFLFCFLCAAIFSQMWNGQDTLSGNEWIDYDQSYFKLKVAEDGIYRLGYEQLQGVGLPMTNIQGKVGYTHHFFLFFLEFYI